MFINKVKIFLVIISLLVISQFVFTEEDKTELIIGVVNPFEVQHERVPKDFITKMKVNTEIPKLLKQELDSKKIFKEVVLINKLENADYYIKGVVVQVCRGNQGLRRYSKNCARGLAFTILQIQIFNTENNIISSREFGENSMGCSKFDVWSNTIHVKKSIDKNLNKIVKYLKNIDLLDLNNQFKKNNISNNLVNVNSTWVNFSTQQKYEATDPWDKFDLWNGFRKCRRCQKDLYNYKIDKSSTCVKCTEVLEKRKQQQKDKKVNNNINWIEVNLLKSKAGQSFREEKYDEAIMYYSQAIELNPNDAGMYIKRAEIFEIKKMSNEMIADYKKSNELFIVENPVDDLVMNLLTRDYTKIRAAAKDIHKYFKYIENEEIIDGIIKALEDYLESPITTGMAVDSMAWLMKSMVSVNSKKFMPVLKKVSTTKKVHRKVKKYAKNTLKEISK